MSIANDCAKRYEDQEARAEVLSREVEARLPDEIMELASDADVWVAREVEDPVIDLSDIYAFALLNRDPSLIGEYVLIAVWGSMRQAAARKISEDRS